MNLETIAPLVAKEVEASIAALRGESKAPAKKESVVSRLRKLYADGDEADDDDTGNEDLMAFQWSRVRDDDGRWSVRYETFSMPPTTHTIAHVASFHRERYVTAVVGHCTGELQTDTRAFLFSTHRERPAAPSAASGDSKEEAADDDAPAAIDTREDGPAAAVDTEEDGCESLQKRMRVTTPSGP